MMISLYFNNWNFLNYFWLFIFVKMILVPELTERGLLLHFFVTEYLKLCSIMGLWSVLNDLMKFSDCCAVF